MKSELKVTLTAAEVEEHLIKPVAKKHKLADGNYPCACSLSGNGEIVLVFSLTEKAP